MMKCLFPLGMIHPLMIIVPSTPKFKRRWFVRLKGQMINRVFYGGLCLRYFFFAMRVFFYTRFFSRFLLHGNCHGLGTCKGCIELMLLATFHSFFPLLQRYHAYFMEDVDSWMIIAADWVAILACTFSIVGIVSKSSHHRRWLWCSFFIGILLSVFWFYFMMSLPRFRWDVIWLPFGPLSGAGICLYVDHLLTESSEEIRKLRGYMYSYKAN
ncbi:hypothetical protein IC582_003036 [Cucumis melo]|uniref:Uncharacterized protein LOC103492288 isoform X1 n=1 Tax=Cucumis melo TaxID=3656 RepID=A0A1S3BQ19_CUCME|nr:uncharacterized protein LOC103492288 isoform X1 [Cucumis melo]